MIGYAVRVGCDSEIKGASFVVDAISFDTFQPKLAQMYQVMLVFFSANVVDVYNSLVESCRRSRGWGLLEK
jgi:hypothetical protein